MSLGPCTLLALLAAGTAIAQDEETPGIHWALSPYLGTGQYKLEDSTINVLSANPSWTVRRSARDEEDRQAVGIRVRIPVAIGVHSIYAFDRSVGLPAIDVTTISAVPGIEFDIPVRARWSLRPVLHIGWGSQTNGSESATIYWTGLKSRGTFAAKGFEWSLINALTHVAFDASRGEEGHFLGLFSAVEFDHTLKQKRLFDHPVILHWHLGRTAYLTELPIVAARDSSPPVDVRDEWEIGGAFSLQDKRLGIWKLRIDRLGIAYRFSTDGKFRGVSITFSSAFDRY